ncbi:hypothetical protein IT882_13035 [Microbacterium schleiferi]|uniref:Uncharacterized protein n=1 Tax=Microbacterium schleiferi TaxID=69362 RepID=A0A7S8RH06_9MICO|nr:hypothetical protein [Microbacterium schleiferi]QPE04117.1 hypothetical protein IT882_13035 [Microbacterium schleiferi]
MGSYSPLYLNQNPNVRTTYGTQRWFTAGQLHARFEDITLDYSDMAGGRIEHQFEWVEMFVGLYARSGASAGQVKAAGIVRKYWGVDTGYVGCGMIPYAGNYSFTTDVSRWRIAGSTLSDVTGYSPWMTAKFHVTF